MEIIPSTLKGLILLEPKIFEDERGYFYESYQAEKFLDFGINVTFVQDNQSKSIAGTLRGLHFQIPPYDQAKLVQVVKGSVMDVAVDIRVGSPTYGKYEVVELSDQNHRQFFIPSGFAHGFLALENNTIFTYKCSNYYHKSFEGGLLWSDSKVDIDWNFKNPLVSEKDQVLPELESFNSPFLFA
jgi:dTDP-4-dehydrorhamnose 3,5-epimerase